jgi:ubiquinone/menaquinone biosynthesis C-methylase UbiE
MRDVASNLIDCIVSADTIEHIPDVYAATAEMFRVLNNHQLKLMGSCRARGTESPPVSRPALKEHMSKQMTNLIRLVFSAFEPLARSIVAES